MELHQFNLLLASQNFLRATMPDLRFDILVGFHVCPRPKLDGESEFCNCVKKKSSVPKLFPLWLTANSQKSCFLLIWSRSRVLILARGGARCGACCRASGRVVRSCARSVDRRQTRFESRPFRARPVKTRRSPPTAAADLLLWPRGECVAVLRTSERGTGY